MLEEYKIINIHDYRKLGLIGKGGFSQVYRIQNKNSGQLYAAKIFRNLTEDDNTKQVQNEASIYSRIDHPNFAKYYGMSPCNFDDEPYQCLIFDYYKNGSLDKIADNMKKGIPTPGWTNTKTLISLYGIAAGSAYLHSKNIMYRDLKIQNVLLDENLYPKLTDFGLSTFFTEESESHTMAIGTPIAMAPELFMDGDGHYTPYIDSYAYSMILYQLIVKKELQIKDKKIRSSQQWLMLIGRGERPEIPESVPNCYRNLITRCWSQDPKKRPKFDEIVDELKNNHEFITGLGDVDEDEFHSYIKMISGEIAYATTENEDIDEIIEVDEKPLLINNVLSVDLQKYERKRLIGEGTFGVVYEVEDKNSKEVYAAKISKGEIYESLSKEIDTVDLIREVMILSKVKHLGIMKFIGYSPVNFKGTPKPTIITEMLTNGTLSDIIELERKGLSLEQWNDTKKLINIYGIASSMLYLHKLGILHRDLKPRNVLVDDFLFPKLADFGLSKDQFCNATECKKQDDTKLVGTPAYIAPEIFEKEEYTEAGDVYAFAFIVYEIMTSEVPSIGKNINQVMFNVLLQIRPKFNVEIPQSYRTLIEDCWRHDPSKRPSFEEIVDRLKNDQGFITDMIDEGEFLDYVDLIDNNRSDKTIFKKIEITNQFTKKEEIRNISTGKGFVNIDEFIKEKNEGRNQYWKYFSVSKKNSKNVYSARMSTIPILNYTKDEIQHLIEEVEILSRLSHPSLLKFIGYSSINFKKVQKPVIITEYAFKQTLEDIIKMKRNYIKSKGLDFTKIHSIIYGIASAMSYLHSHDVLHRDLTPCNIFFDNDLYPKITDYGLYTKIQISKSLSCQSSSKMQNDPHYAAPEILQFEEPSKSSDVYSFSMIVYEILTKNKPFSHLKTTNEVFHEVVHKNGRPLFPPNNEIPIFYREIIESCWAQNPLERPSFDDIVYRLKIDQRFFNDYVRKEEFDKYVDYIDSNKEQCTKQNKIEETEPQTYKIIETNEEDEKSNDTPINNESSSTPIQDYQSQSSNLETSSFNDNISQFESNNKPQQENKFSESKIEEHIDSPKPTNQPEEKEASKCFDASEDKPQSCTESSSLSDILTAFNEIRDDKSRTKWTLAGFEEKSKNWFFCGKGEGEYDEMIANIQPEFIGFCYFRANSTSRGINHPVFVIVKYLPSKAKLITKAQMNAKRGYIENIFNYSNISIEASSLNDLSDEISKKLK